MVFGRKSTEMALDYEIAQATIWMEARGESFETQVCVAWVIINRLRSEKFGKSLGAVCLAPHQFSCWNTNDPNRAALAAADPLEKAWLECEQAMWAALHPKEPDPTDGALYYANTKQFPLGPAPGLKKTHEIGRLSFFN